MYGCPLNEAWGDDFSKKKKKKHKPPLSPQEDNLLVSESDKVQFNQEISAYQKLQGLELQPHNFTDSNYATTHDSLQKVNPSVIQEPSKVKEQIERPLRTISEEEWNEYLDYKRWKTHKPQRQHQRHQIIEGYRQNQLTTQEDQFNELLLYIFTGLFLLFLYDNIYKLGKKSY